MNKTDLEQLLINTFNIKDTLILEQLNIYYNMLVSSSKVMNLTTITELTDAYIKHFYDSLLLSKSVNLNDVKTLADIGTGAGFPGLVLKIVYPKLKVTLIEPTTKRCNFLQSVIDKLELKDITVVNDRAENAIKNYREKFDIVTARAVANLSILLEITTPFVSLTGKFVALKGSSYEEEINNSKHANKILNLKIVKTDLYKLPLDMGERSIIIYKKTKQTPLSYPRLYAQIKKNPL